MKLNLFFTLIFAAATSIASSQVKLYYAKDKNKDGNKEIIVGILKNDTIYSTDRYGNNPVIRGLINGNYVFRINEKNKLDTVFDLNFTLNLNLISCHYAYVFGYDYSGGLTDGQVICPYTSDTKKIHYGFIESDDLNAAGALVLLEYISSEIEGSPYRDETNK